MLDRPSNEHIKTLEGNLLVAQTELTKIKSVQLELVKHSLLKRKIIKIGKQLEAIQFREGPKKVKSVFRVLRVR